MQRTKNRVFSGKVELCLKFSWFILFCCLRLTQARRQQAQKVSIFLAKISTIATLLCRNCGLPKMVLRGCVHTIEEADRFNHVTSGKTAKHFLAQFCLRQRLRCYNIAACKPRCVGCWMRIAQSKRKLGFYFSLTREVRSRKERQKKSAILAVRKICF